MATVVLKLVARALAIAGRAALMAAAITSSIRSRPDGHQIKFFADKAEQGKPARARAYSMMPPSICRTCISETVVFHRALAFSQTTTGTVHHYLLSACSAAFQRAGNAVHEKSPKGFPGRHFEMANFILS